MGSGIKEVTSVGRLNILSYFGSLTVNVVGNVKKTTICLVVDLLLLRPVRYPLPQNVNN